MLQSHLNLASSLEVQRTKIVNSTSDSKNSPTKRCHKFRSQVKTSFQRTKSLSDLLFASRISVVNLTSAERLVH